MLTLEGQPPRIPVVVITGFLGSGKTTLLNRLVTTPAFRQAAVVVNEYGEISIDHVLVQTPKRRLRVVDSGCLCGHVHEEIATALLDLYAKRESGADLAFDCVLIEMSGLADPVPVVQILLTDRHLVSLYQLKTVVTLADGVHGAVHLDQNDEAVKQAAVADTIVLSKTDIAEPGQIDALSARLAELNPGARLLRAVHGALDARDLLDRAGFELGGRNEDARGWLADADYTANTRAASADPSIATFSLIYDEEITLPGLVLWMNLLAGFRGAGLLRVKGIVNVEGRPYAVQAVQTIISEPMPLDEWPEEDDRRSRLVFITRGMNADDVRRTFATFRFEGGRAQRNMAINPATYERFRETIELFRTSPTHKRIGNKVTDLEFR